MNTVKVIAIIRDNTSNLKRDLRNRIDAMLERAVVAFFEWAFSKRAVQWAVAESISCRTPIGQMLNEHISDEIDGADLSGTVEREVGDCVESAIDEYFRNYSIEADRIDQLDKVIHDVVEENMSEIVGEVLDELAKRFVR